MFELITLELLYCQSMPSKKRVWQDVQMVNSSVSGSGDDLRSVRGCRQRLLPSGHAFVQWSLQWSPDGVGWICRVVSTEHAAQGVGMESTDGWRIFFSGEFFIVFPCWGVLMEEYLIFRVYRHWSCIFGPLNSHFGRFCAFVLRPQLKLWISMKNWLVCRDQLRLFIL